MNKNPVLISEEQSRFLEHPWTTDMVPGLQRHTLIHLYSHSFIHSTTHSFIYSVSQSGRQAIFSLMVIFQLLQWVVDIQSWVSYAASFAWVNTVSVEGRTTLTVLTNKINNSVNKQHNKQNFLQYTWYDISCNHSHNCLDQVITTIFFTGNKPRLTEAYISEPEAQLAPDRVDLWGHDTELKALSSALTTDDIILVC